MPDAAAELRLSRFFFHAFDAVIAPMPRAFCRLSFSPQDASLRRRDAFFDATFAAILMLR